MDRREPPAMGQGPMIFPQQPGQGPASGMPVQPQGGPPVGQMPRPRMESYYSNCAMVVTSPREISVIFGRYVPAPPEGDRPGMMPMYEKQIMMTVEQASDVLDALQQAVEDFRAKLAENVEK